MRFLVKLALLIGLVLFFLAPSREDEAGLPQGLSPTSLLFGVQQAFADLSGFCERAPLACESGRDAVAFAGARIAEGMAFVYGLATNVPSAVQPAAEPPLEPGAAVPDAPPPPRPYAPPVGDRASRA